MCQRIKTRTEVANQAFLNQSDIAKLLDCSRPSAKRIYDYARQIDDEQKFIVEPVKVRITTVCKVVGLSLVTVQKIAKKKIHLNHPLSADVSTRCLKRHLHYTTGGDYGEKTFNQSGTKPDDDRICDEHVPCSMHGRITQRSAYISFLADGKCNNLQD